MQKIQVVSGVSEVYPSRLAKGFDKAEEYPIGWEAIFVNDKAGKKFSKQLLDAVGELPDGKVYILNLEGTEKDVARSLEFAFADKDSLRRTLNKAFDGITFYDEKSRSIKPRLMFMEEAKQVSIGVMRVAS